MTDRLTPAAALKKLADVPGSQFVEVFSHCSLEVEIYKPDEIDRQQPHSRDEIYVVISGSGNFVNGNQRHPFEAGEVLFVPAGVVHRFEDFSNDFATWVFFYGPEGGEAGM
ncbi:MAG: cupin domain-containing protein [Rhodothermales bacterium]|nr:cupin domain-containing protein [Rhodothermales bacterium]